MASFTVYGPCKVPVTKLKAGRVITKENVAAFWEKYPDVSGECGCYVFGFKASKGSKPVYVGKATKTFKQEVFTAHKLDKYHTGLGDQVKGTPILFFVSYNRTKGAVSKSAIDEAESYLIQAALVANKKILNDKKISVEAWSIGGVIRSKGKASAAASALKNCIKL
jgi:hypothetical protein